MLRMVKLTVAAVAVAAVVTAGFAAAATSKSHGLPTVQLMALALGVKMTR